MSVSNNHHIFIRYYLNNLTRSHWPGYAVSQTSKPKQEEVWALHTGTTWLWNG